MTRMSDLSPRPYLLLRSKCLESQRRSHLARSLQGTRILVESALPILVLALAAVTLVGCVIPPSLKVEDDTDSPPAITSVVGVNALDEPGPVLFERGAGAGSVRVSLIDTDVQDMLYVRIFVDYNLPESQPERLPARASCNVGPSGTAARTTTCDMSGVCAAADIGVQRNMTIVVFDRQPVDTGSDPRVMMGDGLSTSRFYFLKCQLPQST